MIFYSNHELAASSQKRLLSQLGSAGGCFSPPEFLSANLTEAQDGYPWGARKSRVPGSRRRAAPFRTVPDVFS